MPRADRVASGAQAVDRVLPAAGLTENGVHAPSAFSSLPTVDAPVPFDTRRAARAVLLAAWIVGTVLALAALCVSLLRVRRLAFRSVDLDDDAWQEAAAEVGARIAMLTPILCNGCHRR